MELDEKLIGEIVRKILTEKMKEDSTEKHIDKSGVLSVKLPTVKCDKFDTGKEGDKVYLKDVVSLEESPRLGCGLMEMDKTCFDWTLNYDEVDYIIKGNLQIIIDGRTISGEEGDIIFIPKGSNIKFNVPDYARFLYVTYPANWSEQKD
ncbi:ethanolamine utilization protein EutQ [Clostridium tetanomorphum]|uniref:DUF861 domain-containing protein n=1 Tax=Clostridium tetanomorphum TaxID=1553 RepID=A0A923E7V3_CLOTT|nr:MULTISPECIES: cupin domain-containing protein [Clostridium]KAJ52584.1 ethanolamine utilization protein EutQ [Clostridium tetanomorphum DSM 665]MBC2396862.1 DUF861 domain-containing protein [Clostridium tetanomorphum]MBC2425524.1 DUF861 domain-containing protein [Clostridium beijerinckii]MBP1863176.1 ethanolamine utilization protein EutQ [Clostridium tetanomorphum]NRS84284.1 ethanolamine utilization protein EutQ [Clostridium tetanomorphum]